MKPTHLGSLLKFTAVIGLAILVRFDVNPILYLLLGMLFYAGWKTQHLPEPSTTKRHARTTVVARRL